MKNLILTISFALLTGALFSQESIRVEKSGSGNPVLYLPGFTCPGTVWNETIRGIELDHENHQVSYAGFNGIEPVEKPWYSKLVNDLTAYIKNEQLNNLTVIGHSMGGNLAIDIAAALPNYVNKLILVESLPCMREVMMPGMPESQIVYDSPYNNQMLQMSDDQFAQTAAMQSSYMTNDTSKIKILTNWIMTADRETYVYGYTDLLKLDQRDKLENIKARSLILGAEFPTREVIEANYSAQYEKLDEKEMYFASNSKHFIMFDQNEWLVNKINGFLNNEEQEK